MLQRLAALNVTLRIEDVPAFLRAAGEAGWSAVDSGERITTDEGVDIEAVLILRIPAIAARIGTAAQ